MSSVQIYDVDLEKDHLEKLTKVSPLKALQEAIWNSLDADSTEVYIKVSKNQVGLIDKLVIEDNGHGIAISKAEKEFKGLGGSFKKNQKKSPNKRSYHGSEGEGRFRLFALGQNINIKSVFFDEENETKKEIIINLDIADLKKFQITSVSNVDANTPTGTRFEIYNTSPKINEIIAESSIDTLEEVYTPYYLTYPTFKIVVDGNDLELQKAVKSKHEESINFTIDNQEIDFKVKIIEWSKNNIDKKINYCDSNGITLEDKVHKMRIGIPISIYVLSDYFKSLQSDGLLCIDSEMNEPLASISKKAKDIAREYALNVLDSQSTEYINKLIEEDIYPYKTEAKTPIEKIERKVFNVTALQIKELIPTNGKKVSKKDKTKNKLTLSLIKEALESNPSKLSEILKAVLGLSKDDQDNFAELLENTTLPSIINTSKEISDRLIKLDGFKSVILGELKEKTLERKHLQKLLVKESWIFGDDYTLGAADNTLKTVLKKYLKELGRDDFEEQVNTDCKGMNLIPDICLWKQYKKGYNGQKENLVIEIKKPKIKVGFNELNQIKKYANVVLKDAAFQDGKTTWTFILLTNDINEDEIGNDINQDGREKGHVVKGKTHSVYVKRWADVLNDAEARLEYLKEQLNIEVQESQGMNLLNKLYPDSMPNTKG